MLKRCDVAKMTKDGRFCGANMCYGIGIWLFGVIRYANLLVLR